MNRLCFASVGRQVSPRRTAREQSAASACRTARFGPFGLWKWAAVATVALVPSTACAANQESDRGDAKTPAEMKPYKQHLSGTELSFEMVPIPGGEFLMGSPESEKKRKPDEGPQHLVKVEPFWMGKHEVTWELYDTWSFKLDIQRREVLGLKPTKFDEAADAVTRPTEPYTDMTFNSGHDGFPAICMTQLAAKMYCQWLSAKTGRFYRLPTEAEWEYAARAGTRTAYFFGDDPSELGDYAWYYENAGEDRQANYHKVGQKKPNPWGLHDIYGNVSEWVLDQYIPDFYSRFKPDEPAAFPLAVPTKEYPRVVRGGSWDDDAEQCRSAARMYSDPDWKIQDPQIPQSIWYFTDALHVGFRVVRPLKEPTEEQKKELKLIPLPEDLEKK